jgi:hypothetical protein
MQAIRTRYHGPSNVRGSRISAKCEARTIYVSYDHALNSEENHRSAARELVRVMDWGKRPNTKYSHMVGGGFAHDMYWVFQDSISTGNAQ